MTILWYNPTPASVSVLSAWYPLDMMNDILTRDTTAHVASLSCTRRIHVKKWGPGDSGDGVTHGIPPQTG